MIIANTNKNYKWWLKCVPKETQWTDINILRFLRLYQSYPQLWDSNNPDYENRWARLCAYKTIAETLNLRNVDEVECTKLVEHLKRRFLEEKEIHRGSREPRPAWFNIINNIIKKILYPHIDNSLVPCCDDLKDQESSSECCKNCQECCFNQNCEIKEKEDVTSTSDTNEENEFENIKCYKISENHLRQLFMNFNTDSGSDCTCKTVDSTIEVDCYFKTDDSTSEVDCDCTTDDSSDSLSCSDTVCPADTESTKIPNFESDTTCDSVTSRTNDNSRTTTRTSSYDCTSSSSTSSLVSSSIQDYSIEDFVTRKPCSLKSSNGQSSTATSVTKDSQEMSYEKRGLFMDSLRFCGKPISLLDKSDGEFEIIEPKNHFASCEHADTYPLQLEL